MTNDLLLQTMTLTKDRPVLSSERAPHNKKTITVKQSKYLVMSPDGGSIPRLTDRQSLCDFDLISCQLTVQLGSYAVGRNRKVALE
jgi:hypothetical protein